jgi:hypothetical protein
VSVRLNIDYRPCHARSNNTDGFVPKVSVRTSRALLYRSQLVVLIFLPAIAEWASAG